MGKGDGGEELEEALTVPLDLGQLQLGSSTKGAQSSVLQPPAGTAASAPPAERKGASGSGQNMRQTQQS